MMLLLVLVSIAVALFAVFPLTDTDIWWHLACAREWVTTWTPVREPVVNVHEYFQQIVAFVYNLGGARLLVAFKAILWGLVFALFLWPSVRTRQDNVIANPIGVKQSIICFAIFAVILFIFRYQFEIRPVLFSLIFLGIYWNILPWLFITAGKSHYLRHKKTNVAKAKMAAVAIAILSIQWFWCRFQGLYILGLLFAFTVFAFEFEVWNMVVWSWKKLDYKRYWGQLAFVAIMLVMPFLHRDGPHLFIYPVGLFDRLVGLSPSAAVFASEIAENRSPITLLMAGENVLQSALMIVLVLAGIALACVQWYSRKSPYSSGRLVWQRTERTEAILDCRLLPFCLVVTAVLALIAERNFVLFLPVFFAVALKTRFFARLCSAEGKRSAIYALLPMLLIAFLFGLWVKSLLAYDSMVAYQRVPVAAAEWMKSHPHSGRLFNDDRAGGYLAFVNPSDSTYIDGRFILKTAEFFENYLRYAESPRVFLHEAELQNMDRVVLPLRYYARWDKLIATLDSAENWHVAYHDPFFVVMDRTNR
ncbi:hypothetical protein [Fibrobacter sp. UWB12]|uniref:hypothetical protein n=1 Tax=Fibrobacter sp. UWB12 TaxID=1896203 RepID=UPI00091BF726|nr:hypothetical protein [Fibrobacter sp. UWB12]SHK27456.1 hypothetical protein SAMN05720759_101456 [Fibrobacter sp. UWB12]